MQLSFGAWWPWLGFPAAALLLWVRRRSLIEFDPRQLNWMVALRAVVYALVLVALTQPVLSRRGHWTSTVYLVDISRSMAPEAVQEAIDWVRATSAVVNDDARFLAFARNARMVPDAESLQRVRVADTAVPGAVDRSGTDLARALNRALSEASPGRLTRIVLLSDGHPTRGNLDAALQRLQLARVPVFTRAAALAAADDVWVAHTDSPSQVVAGAPFQVTVTVNAPRPVQAVVAILQRGQPVAAEQVQLEAGANQVRLLPVLEATGPVDLDAVVRVDADPVHANDGLRFAVQVRPRPRLLYFEGVPNSSAYLTAALRDGGFDVVVRTASALSLGVAELEPYDAVILSDVAADRISPASMEALADYVERLGGGLLLAGGESVYGEGGYADTRLEQILPVWFKAERKPRDLVLVIALDKSYSMVGEKMALAKEASKAAVQMLEKDQRFGLLAFDYHFYWPVPIQSAANKSTIQQHIAGIEASSPTNIYPALQDVYRALQATDAEVKHVILLSDGKTYEDDYEGLVSRMAEDRITVSSVAVGDKADRELLANIARWGKGRAYYIQDPTRVPQIFIDETRMAQGITIEETEPIVPEVRKRIEAFAGLDLDQLPQLRGYVRTTAKDHAEVILDTGPEGDPILVRWQYGLGRTVVFASDVKNRWSARWLRWEGYGKFWSQLVRETMRHEAGRESRLTLRHQGDGVVVTLDWIDPRGRFRDGQRPEVELTDAGGARRVEMAQVAPGRYQARVPRVEGDALTARWDGGPRPVQRRLVFARARETSFRSADETLLQHIAEATGGVYDPTPEQLRAVTGRSVVRRYRLWPVLLAVALLLYLTNLLLRRVRVFGRDALQRPA